MRGSKRYACFAVGLVLGLVFAAPAARSQSAPSLVVIVTSDPAAAAARRLSKDLQGLGLDVLVLKATPENSSGRESLEKSARSVGAIAAVRLVPAGEGTEVWVADRVTGKTVIRDLVGATPETGPDDVALGAIELLRASLMELHSPGAPPSDAELTPAVRDLSFAVPAAPSTPAKRPVPMLSLMVGPSVDVGLRSIGPSLGSNWALWARLGSGFGTRAFVALPIVPERASVVEGDVTVSSSVMGLGFSYDYRRGENVFAPYIGLGFAAARVVTIGSAIPPALSTSDSAWYTGGYSQLGAGLEVTQGLRLYVDGTALLLAQAPGIRVDNRTVGRWGAPAVVGSMGLEVSWSR
jgi:hypothetical protein